MVLSLRLSTSPGTLEIAKHADLIIKPTSVCRADSVSGSYDPPVFNTYYCEAAASELRSFAHFYLFFFRQFLDYVVKTTLREKKKKGY